MREEGKEFVGTASALYGISAAVYLSLMGPKGMQELGQVILQKSQYAMKKLSELAGVKIKFNASFFKEFVVDFSETGKSVQAINAALMKEGIYGGHDLTPLFDDLKECALYCVTENTTKNMIDSLVSNLKQILM